MFAKINAREKRSREIECKRLQAPPLLFPNSKMFRNIKISVDDPVGVKFDSSSLNFLKLLLSQVQHEIECR